MTRLPPIPHPTSPGDPYILALSCVLLGYAVMGKGFAYFGYPPFFVGELAFLAGFLVLLRSGCLVAVFAFGPSLLLAATMGWTLLRTLPFVGTYGFDALRDSVIIMYGGFSFIVAALLIEDARRIDTLVRYYQVFLGIYVPAVPFLFPLGFYFVDYVPNVPGTNVSLIWLGAGEVATHLAGAAVFALAGFRRPTPVWTACLLAALVMVSAVSRAAMLAFVVPVVLAALLLGKARMLAVIIAAGLMLLATSYALETSFSSYQEARSSTERRVSSVQVVENVASIFGQGGDQTEDTKEWRAKWWNIIVDNTVHGPYFWTGRGFGVNLGFEDGFASRHTERPLRSPHNGHMTILARAGIPGAALWGVFLAAWLGALLHATWLARRCGQAEWAGLLLFIACYATSCVINATFDVALEAPMQGIWFWCLIGFGIGTTMIYRYMQDNRSWKARLGRQILPARARQGLPPA
ncbi:MAG: O-antigen ligase protein [Bradyrhizobium sp.]|nr:O-antigen ligase protein [Bradyrhizobium sp.]